ncbi:DinB family protein [Kitasatospora sp. RB6PN24]|uniref:DinB family protein n=1 Tax=Kitasatospora humi TaxID=2893891 RepID=UPI001E29D370|nr:DinB family protein [Kitasatospora humi]MCC9307398.1 DinB family protein [Kitasatospora humi]
MTDDQLRTENRPADVDAKPPTVDSDERATLLAFLDYLREAVVAKAQGLAGDLARVPGVPSGTNLLGLVKHLTEAEMYWFEWVFDGAEVEVPDFGMELGEGDTEESVVAGYRAAVARSNEVIARCADLGQVAARATGKQGVPRSMRWILVHMIEETARHAGHADILREQADGSVGR